MKSLDALTTQCIRCGFCLEDCPTFLETGSELESPRGRIYLVRSAVEGKLNWLDDVKPHLDQCLGCRACETACPSGVEYGAILEIARDKIEQDRPSLIRKSFLAGTTTPAILKTQLALGKLLPGKRMPAFLSRILSGEAPETDLPTPQKVGDLPPLKELPPVRGSVYMLEGCAMRVLYPRVHACTVRLLRRLGYEVKHAPQGCCGALHAHNGDLDTAKKMAKKLIRALEGDLPIIVNSAGCGSTMKEYPHLVDGEASAQFAERVQDITEFFLSNGLQLLLSETRCLSGKTLTYHDACHLSHGQKITSAPRLLVQAVGGANYVELGEATMCCGSAGIYNIVQPKLARKFLNRKVNNILETKADVVATGNPGCHAWISQGCKEQQNSAVLHTAELLEAAFIGLEYFSD
jgi:glycolate oxidase iron-sulfur subunit